MCQCWVNGTSLSLSSHMLLESVVLWAWALCVSCEPPLLKGVARESNVLHCVVGCCYCTYLYTYLIVIGNVLQKYYLQTPKTLFTKRL